MSEESANPDQNSFEYPQERWRRDWDKILEATLTVPREQSEQYAHGLFHSLYADPAEADWKLNRIKQAYLYADKYMEAFERGGWAVASSKKAAYSGEIAFALYRFFSCGPDSKLKNPPPPEAFMKAAEEQIARRKAT